MPSRLPSLAVLLPALACGTTPAPRSALEAPNECAGSLQDVSAREDPSLGEPAPAATVVAVAIRGAASVPETLVREAVRLETGVLLSESALRADVRRILELRVFEDVRVHVHHVTDGVQVTYEVVERPMIASARLVGEGGAAALHRVEGLRGEVFQPGRLHRLSRKIVSDRRRDGFAEVTTRVSARRGEDGVAVCMVVDAGRRWVIDTLEVAGNEAIDDDALLEVMATLEGRVNAEGGIYREDLIEEDLQRMLALYFDAGHVSARIGAPETRWEGDALHVAIPVTEGPVYTLRELRVSGDLAGPANEYVDFLGLEVDVPFDRAAIAGAIERLAERERARGNFSVYPTTQLDPEGHFVDLEVQVEDLDAPDPPERNRPEGDAPRLIDEELRGPDSSLAPQEAP
ncbi:MAG: hypothetical protein JJ863_15855 [Deltaproteobacteria bacterium]|nr:hypothetical protein [Deltaproteobacteria bacterium]